MDIIALQTLLIAVVVGISCGILGIFLVLRKMSMMIDAISHTVLLGIVLAYMVTKDLSSPLLTLGATMIGVLTVFLIEILVKTKRTSEDAATGAVFPFLFSLAVIIITTQFRSTHLDSHAINGNLEFAAFETLTLFGLNLGSKTLFTNVLVLLLLIGVIVLLFKELKLSTFDEALAKTLGFMPGVLHYLLMTLVSLTAVTSFNAVGSILVIAMMIGPAVTSLLLTKELKTALFTSAIIAAFNASLGYFVSMVVLRGHVNIAATIATVTFITFFIVWIFEPKKGLITSMLRKQSQKKEFELLALMMHVATHQDTKEKTEELRIDQIILELNWTQSQYDRRVEAGKRLGYLKEQSHLLELTTKGIQAYQFKIKELTEAS